MRGFFEAYSGRKEYRLASVMLLVGSLVPLLLSQVVQLSSAAALLAFAIGLSLYTVLAILTYYRLRNASLSGWWLLPMIVIFHIGPRWQLGSWEWGSANFAPSGIVSLIPVFIGWFASTGSANDSDPKETKAS